MQLLANIDVENVAAATDFYCRALGLKVGRRLGPGAVELLGASSPIYLLEKPAASAATGSGHRRGYARHWTPVHLDFVVPDIQAASATAIAAGAAPEGEVRTHVWGHIAVFSDPFGNGFCLIQFLNRGYDEIAT
ncbi:VOC family protein [Hyphomicrobium sp. CS1GBMeth3]|uniref:VOC family protein n=1 Tax=Hyphomicrobium sp. CS1GBMeth3 TaxID=1892845 RepID=UPI000930EF78|nr:VOC family protein [Hyphomicrobium sp. CS1GBMeth3]